MPTILHPLRLSKSVSILISWIRLRLLITKRSALFPPLSNLRNCIQWISSVLFCSFWGSYHLASSNSTRSSTKFASHKKPEINWRRNGKREICLERHALPKKSELRLKISLTIKSSLLAWTIKHPLVRNGLSSSDTEKTTVTKEIYWSTRRRRILLPMMDLI